MASTKIKIALAVLLAASVVTLLLLQYQRNSVLRQEFRQQQSELDQLRPELQRLTDEAQSVAKQREKERAELARLRGELLALRGRESKTATASNAALAARPQKPETPKESTATFLREDPALAVTTSRQFQQPGPALRLQVAQEALHWSV